MMFNFDFRSVRPWLLALLMVLLLSACEGGEENNELPTPTPTVEISFEGEVVIYVVGPMSGPDAQKGQAQAAGARLAAAEWNAKGGLLKRKIIIKEMNDAGDPDKALQAAQKIEEAKEEVIGVVLHEGSDPQLTSVKQVYGPDQNRSLVVAPVSSNPLPVALDLENEQYDRFFRLSAPNVSQASEIATTLQEQNLHEVVVVHNSTSYGKALAEEFSQAVKDLDVHILETFEISPDAISYHDVVTQIREINPAALFYAGEDVESALFLSQLFSFEFQGKVFGSDRALLYSVVDELSCQAEGMSFTSLLPDPATVMSPEQLAIYSSREGREAELYTVAGHSGVEFMVKAFEAAGTLDADQAATQARQTTISTLLGEIAFDANGTLQKPKMHFFQVQGRQFKESFVREVGTGPQASQGSNEETKTLLDVPFAADKEPIIFAGLNWDSAQFNNSIARVVIESGYGYPTYSKYGSSVPLFQSLRQGDLHVYMELWLPNSQELYDNALANQQIVDLGLNFGDVTQGWFVPKYVIEGDSKRGIEAAAPDLKSVMDLEQYANLFASQQQPAIGRLMDGSPGWFSYKIDCMKLKAYRLDDKYAQITTGSESALFAELSNAYENGQPMLFYIFEPTWPIAAFDLQQLEEPEFTQECWDTHKGCAFPPSQVKIVAHSDLPQHAPEVAEFLAKYSLDSDQISRILLTMKENNLTPQEAAQLWLKENEQVWSQWLPNDVAQRVKEQLEP